MDQNNHVPGPAEVLFDRKVDQYGWDENEQVELITSFFLSGIIDIGLAWLNEHPRELPDFLQFIEDNYSPRRPIAFDDMA